MGINASRHNRSVSRDLYITRLRTRALPVSSSILPLRSSSVPLDEVAEDGTPDSGFRTPKMTVTHIRKLDIYQRESIRD